MTEHSPLPWLAEPDDREGMGWNVHIVERDHTYMRVCFMSNCQQAEANADLIIKSVNNHDMLVKALRDVCNAKNDPFEIASKALANLSQD